MGKEDKKKIRLRFRDAVFCRDRYACRVCIWNETPGTLDAHHITDRNLMPGGGYVKENGITLCPECHELAEELHRTGISHKGYSPEDLYLLIGSSYDIAYAASLKQERFGA